MEYTSRKRIETSLEHKEPDRVPIAIGGLHDSVHLYGHRKLLEYYNIENGEETIQDPFQQIVFPHEALLEKFRSDIRPVYAQPGSSYTFEYYEEGDFKKYRDEWGTVYRQPREGGIWFDFESNIWTGKSAEEIKNHKLPDPTDPHRFDGLRDRVKKLIDETDKAVVAYAPTGGVYEHTYWLRGMEDTYMDMAADVKMVELVADRVVEWMVPFWDLYMKEIGDLVQVVQIGDDLGGQDGPLFSPKLYRSVFKPREKMVIDAIKKRTKAKVYFHSCGAIREYIPDLIEIGVDVLNPVQVGAAGMASKGLKKDFGDDISFWGGGADPAEVMAKGKPDDVRDEVKRRLDDFAPDGGFVFASIHNTQSEVPPENIEAFFETAYEYGKY